MIIGTKSKLGRSPGANPLGSGCSARHCILLRHNCHNLKGLFSVFFAFMIFRPEGPGKFSTRVYPQLAFGSQIGSFGRVKTGRSKPGLADPRLSSPAGIPIEEGKHRQDWHLLEAT
jgi:hypothetical protein